MALPVTVILLDEAGEGLLCHVGAVYAEFLEMVILAILALPAQCGRVQSLSERC